jgi:dTMP kinase
MAKIIVIEGIDGSGKQTQARLLVKRLEMEGHTVKALAFPNYESNSSVLVKMYLNGEMGERAEDVSPYAAGSFYAMDRYVTLAQMAISQYDYVICDRYSTSNLIHQSVKLQDYKERKDFIEFMDDFEHSKLGIPRADKVLLLDLPTRMTESLMRERAKKFEGEDIHERDRDYMRKCAENARVCAELFGWTVVDCVDKGELLDIETIHAKIWEELGL